MGRSLDPRLGREPDGTRAGPDAAASVRRHGVRARLEFLRGRVLAHTRAVLGLPERALANLPPQVLPGALEARDLDAFCGRLVSDQNWLAATAHRAGPRPLRVGLTDAFAGALERGLAETCDRFADEEGGFELVAALLAALQRRTIAAAAPARGARSAAV
jgi:hypothetical protein